MNIWYNFCILITGNDSPPIQWLTLKLLRRSSLSPFLVERRFVEVTKLSFFYYFLRNSSIISYQTGYCRGIRQCFHDLIIRHFRMKYSQSLIIHGFYVQLCCTVTWGTAVMPTAIHSSRSCCCFGQYCYLYQGGSRRHDLFSLAI